MNGLEMMLKGMGLDPKAMMAQAEQVMQAVVTVGKKLTVIDERLARIEAALNIVPADKGQAETKQLSAPEQSNSRSLQ